METSARLAFVKSIAVYHETPTAENMRAIIHALGALDLLDAQTAMGSALAIAEIQQEHHPRLFDWKRRATNAAGAWLMRFALRPTDRRFSDYLLTRYALVDDTRSLQVLHVRACHSVFPAAIAEHAAALLERASRDLPRAAADLETIRLNCLGCAITRPL